MKFRTGLFAAITLAISSTGFAQTKLDVGSTAPGLDIDTWVKGDETTLSPGKVYVVEFWATWCGPCKRSIPHLTAVQKQYADDGLTIIGVSTDSEQTVDKVKPFVKTQGDKMAYTVAIDRHDGTKRAWLEAAGKNGIPCAFIVDRAGKIAFIGNPLPEANEGFDTALKGVMSGRHDPNLVKQAEPALRAARSARTERNWRVALRQYDEVIKVDGRVFANVAMERFEMQVVDMNEKAEAYKYAKETLIEKTFANDAESLRGLAEKIATDPKIDPTMRDLDVALTAAESARKLPGGENDPQSLNTLALVRFSRGEIDKAIELQKQAWMQAPPKYKADFHHTLTTYQEASQRTSMISPGK